MHSLLNDTDWRIEESGFDISTANVLETLLTVGNGYLGTRGTLEEGFKGERSGTYLNGVFDGHDSPVIDQVNAPDWLSVVVHANGVRLDVQTCRILSHRRALDMRQGVLWRETLFADAQDRQTRIETLRFASSAEQRLCVLRVSVTALNYAGDITVESAIDGRRFNLDRLPVYLDSPQFAPEVKWEKWAKSLHLRQVAATTAPESLYLEMQTIGTGIRLGYAATTLPSVEPLRNIDLRSHERVAERMEFALAQGASVVADKFVAICTSRDMPAEEVENQCHTILARHTAMGFEAALAANREVWLEKWADCDVVVSGDAAATQAARFSIYHLLIAANGNDPKANIGAKSLSGEGYRGHVFWDTEIFMLPFYIYTQPDVAKALLLYRYNTLPGARQNASANGFRGAQYAWESADTGLETTPKWTPDGKHRIWTGEEEIHVSADVAYGVLTYVAATADMEFMDDFGAEILFETSRFWVSRLKHDPARNRFVLTQVIGPDEFHEHVDNNAFTNRMAQWHLVQAARIYDEMAARNPAALARITTRIGLEATEPRHWVSVANQIFIPFDADRGLVEQFENYFTLTDVPVTEWDANDMPCYPPGYDHFNLNDTQLLKQPDVIMLTYILPDEFSTAAKRANYAYYEPRTLHKSSLSPAIHSIMGIEVGDTTRALQYFRRSALADLSNNQGNTQDGMHIASAAGTWQALVFGFGGFRLKHGQMSFNPWLPPDWSELRFGLRWRGNRLSVRISHADMSFVLSGPSGTQETVRVGERTVVLNAGRPTSAALRMES